MENNYCKQRIWYLMHLIEDMSESVVLLWWSTCYDVPSEYGGG